MFIKGQILAISEPQTSGEYQKIEIKIKTDEKFPQILKMDIPQKNFSQIQGINITDKVDIGFNIQGRETKIGYFMHLSVWRITLIESEKPKPLENDPIASLTSASISDDDMPF